MSAPFFASVGLNNMVCANRVLAIITPKSKTARDYVRLAKQAGTLLDVSMGKTIKSVVLFDNGYILLSHISTATLRFRFSNIHKPKPWKSSEEYREKALGEDDASILLDSDDEEEDEEEDEYGIDLEVQDVIGDEEEDE